VFRGFFSRHDEEKLMNGFVRIGLGMGLLTVLGLLLASTSGAADDDKVTIKEVMKKAHTGKPKLCEKVATGKASKEEKEKLVDLYTALSKNKPPKGEEDSWKEKTAALVKAAKACADDDKDGPNALKKAVNCKACHEVHKGK
jgi:hypothetical protein